MPGVGDTLGRYTLLKRIAAGGMGEIYLAARVGPLGFSPPIALKILRAELATESEFVDMLVDEANISMILNHQNVVSVLDFGEEDGTYYLAMEYVQGANLQMLVETLRHKQQRVEISLGLYIGIELCRALKYAHGRANNDGEPLNIVHRDVTPGNVLLSTTGEVKLTDFGIAKAKGRIHKTQAGVLKGKFGYMAPEVIRYEKIDGRADIFCLGVVLYEMLAGRHPADGSNIMEAIERFEERKISPPSSINPEIPKALDAVIMRALEPKVSDRWPTAAALGSALQELALESSAQRLKTGATRLSELLKIHFPDVFEGVPKELTDRLLKETRAKEQAKAEAAATVSVDTHDTLKPNVPKAMGTTPFQLRPTVGSSTIVETSMPAPAPTIDEPADAVGILDEPTINPQIVRRESRDELTVPAAGLFDTEDNLRSPVARPQSSIFAEPVVGEPSATSQPAEDAEAPRDATVSMMSIGPESGIRVELRRQESNVAEAVSGKGLDNTLPSGGLSIKDIDAERARQAAARASEPAPPVGGDDNTVAQGMALPDWKAIRAAHAAQAEVVTPSAPLPSQPPEPERPTLEEFSDEQQLEDNLGQLFLTDPPVDRTGPTPLPGGNPEGFDEYGQTPHRPSQGLTASGSVIPADSPTEDPITEEPAPANNDATILDGINVADIMAAKNAAAAARKVPSVLPSPMAIPDNLDAGATQKPPRVTQPPVSASAARRLPPGVIGPNPDDDYDAPTHNPAFDLDDGDDGGDDTSLRPAVSRPKDNGKDPIDRSTTNPQVVLKPSEPAPRPTKSQLDQPIGLELEPKPKQITGPLRIRVGEDGSPAMVGAPKRPSAPSPVTNAQPPEGPVGSETARWLKGELPSDALSWGDETAARRVVSTRNSMAPGPRSPAPTVGGPSQPARGGLLGVAGLPPVAGANIPSRVPGLPKPRNTAVLVAAGMSAVAVVGVVLVVLSTNLLWPSIKLASEPRGATVTIDGKTLSVKTPLEIKMKPNVDHRLELAVDGYAPKVIEGADARASYLANKAINVVLERSKRIVHISPRAGQVFLNDRPVGSGSDVELPDVSTQGTPVRIRVESAGYKPWSISFDNGMAVPASIDVPLQADK